jgi:CHAT domain-containing protein/Tfp pilus assembly protein PilF
LEQALAINKEVLGERHPNYASSLNSLANLLQSRGDYAAARPLYEQSLAINKEVLGERHSKIVGSLTGLARSLQLQKNYAAARPLFERALALTKDVLGERHPAYAAGLNNLALLLASQGDDAASRPLFEQALAITKDVLGERHPRYAMSLSALGLCLWVRGDPAAAAPLLRQALEIVETNLDLAAATQSERQQLAMARDLSADLDNYLSVSPLAKISPRDAYRHLLIAKGAVFERQRWLRTQRQRYPSGSEAAKLLEEYTKTVAQLSALALGEPDLGKPQEWKARIEELSQRKDKLEAELSRLDVGFGDVKHAARRTMEQLQEAIPKHAVLIDFLVYEAALAPVQGKSGFQWVRRVLAFVVRPGHETVRIELGPLAPIDAAVNAWRPLLVSGKADAAGVAAAATLRRLIWEPVEAHLEGASLVLVSPDGAIGLVPFCALPAKKPGHYLIEERSFAVIPVPRMLNSVATADQPAYESGVVNTEKEPSLLVAGDIEYGADPGAGMNRGTARSAAVSTRAGFSRKFSRLGGTRNEILAISDSFERRYSKARVDMLRESAANEEAFRRLAPKSRYLHLATHGYFAPPELQSALGPTDLKTVHAGSDPLGGAGVAGWHPGLLSGIALAGANVRPTPIGHDDGIVTALEVAELDLSGVELAVLSACETGMGAVAGGEGLLGLQRAFQVAGAHAVVASLWKVNDAATSVLMERFYDNLWVKKLPKLEALRQAQLAVLNDPGLVTKRRAELAKERGIGETAVKLPESGQVATPNPRGARSDPSLWAAFVLSGDTK